MFDKKEARIKTALLFFVSKGSPSHPLQAKIVQKI
jgi:hypothetical protein